MITKCHRFDRSGLRPVRQSTGENAFEAASPADHRTLKDGFAARNPIPASGRGCVETPSGCGNSQPFDTTGLRESVSVDFESPARSREVVEGFWRPVLTAKWAHTPANLIALMIPSNPKMAITRRRL